MPAYGKYQSRFDQIQEAGNKSQKTNAFLHEEMGINCQIEEEFNHEDANYYDSPELDYYEPDAFNQPDNPPDAYYVENPKEYECQHCGSHFSLNNKLHSHLRGNYNKRLDNSLSQKKYDTVHAFSSVTDLPASPKSIDTSQNTSVKDTRIIHFIINPSVDIRTGYGFRGYHYLKGKIALSLSSSLNSVCFDTGCSVTLYDIAFFSTQAPNTPIRKMATRITVRCLGANQYATDQYAIADIYISAKDGQGQEVIVHIRREIHLVEELKANMLVGTDIMTPEQFVLDLNKKTAFIGSCSYSFDLDIEIPRVSIKRPVHAKTRVTILPHTMQVITIHYLNIPHSRDFLFQPDNVDFALSAYLVDANITGLPVENNTDKPIYISRNFRLGRIQELTYPNIEQLHSQEATLAKQIPYNQHKKAWLKKVIGACYAVYEEQQEKE